MQRREEDVYAYSGDEHAICHLVSFMSSFNYRERKLNGLL